MKTVDSDHFPALLIAHVFDSVTAFNPLKSRDR